MKRITAWILGVILVLSVLLRLTIAFQSGTVTYDSYFTIKQVEAIKTTGLPLFDDPLSYGGRAVFLLPLFFYIVAALSYAIPLKYLSLILPSILLSTVPYIVFLITKELTKKEEASLFGAATAAFIPAIFLPTTLTPLTLALPLTTLALYFFIKGKNPPRWYVITIFIAGLTSSTIGLFFMGLLIYMFLLSLEQKKGKKREQEVIFFSIFLFLWTQILFFKNRLLSEGVSFMWDNVPAQAIQQYFPSLSIAQAIFYLSPIPLIAGLYVIYQEFFRRSKGVFLIVSLATGTIFITFLRLISQNTAFAVIGIMISILVGVSYQNILKYFKKTNFAKGKKMIRIVSGVLLVVTVLPAAVSFSLQAQGPSQSDIQAFTWIKENTNEEVGVVGLLEEGHIITALAKRRNIMDERFDARTDEVERLNDLTLLYTTQFQTQAISLLDKYDMQYIVLSSQAQEKYNALNYLSNNCFELVYNQQAKIYKVTCTIMRE